MAKEVVDEARYVGELQCHAIVHETNFVEDCVVRLIADHQSTAVIRRRANTDIQSLTAERRCTLSSHCRVCGEKHNRYRQCHPGVGDKDIPHQMCKTRMWCSECKEYLCVREGSTCFRNSHEEGILVPVVL